MVDLPLPVLIVGIILGLALVGFAFYRKKNETK